MSRAGEDKKRPASDVDMVRGDKDLQKPASTTKSTTRGEGESPKRKVTSPAVDSVPPPNHSQNGARPH